MNNLDVITLSVIIIFVDFLYFAISYGVILFTI